MTQKLSLDFIIQAKKQKIKELEKEFDYIKSSSNGEKIICPVCNYISNKNPKGSAIVFQNGNETTIKCFSCGIWRKIK